MPRKTPPVEHFIPRQTNSEIQPLLDLFSELLEELVNFGSHIFSWDAKPATKGEENLPPTMLFRHYLDLLDSLSILAKQACGDPMKILVRGLFETKLFIDYLFEKDSYQRALAYVYLDVQSQIKTLTLLNPLSPRGKELRKTLHREGLSSNLKIKKSFSFVDEIANLETVISESKYQNIHVEYQELKQSKSKITWYSLFGGPKTVELLAAYLGVKSQYDLLYRTWSETVHALGVHQGKISSMPDGTVGITQLRDPRHVQMLTHYCMTFTFGVFKTYIYARIPDKAEMFHQWYGGLREVYLDLGETQRIVVAE